jgi:hypothetical protein
MATRTQVTRKSTSGWRKLSQAEVAVFSTENKRLVKAKVDLIIEGHMKPAVIKPAGRRAAFADVLDIYTKWHGDSLVLIARRRGGQVMEQDVPEFETRSGRLTLVGDNLFDLAYFRHTGRWWTIMQNCLWKTVGKFLQEPSPLWPW